MNGTYNTMFMTGKLHEHLVTVDKSAEEMFELIVK